MWIIWNTIMPQYLIQYFVNLYLVNAWPSSTRFTTSITTIPSWNFQPQQSDKSFSYCNIAIYAKTHYFCRQSFLLGGCSVWMVENQRNLCPFIIIIPIWITLLSNHLSSMFTNANNPRQRPLKYQNSIYWTFPSHWNRFHIVYSECWNTFWLGSTISMYDYELRPF